MNKVIQIIIIVVIAAVCICLGGMRATAESETEDPPRCSHLTTEQENKLWTFKSRPYKTSIDDSIEPSELEPEPIIETVIADQDLRYMSAIIYAEAENQCTAGQQAVGIVVQNRSDSSTFANGIYNVIYESGQFTPVRNGSLSKALNLYDSGGMPNCYIEAARYALAGNKTVNYNGSTIDLTGIYYFSRHLSGAKFTIQSHQFK